MSNWYISASTGNDSTGNGSQATPWMTLTHAVANSVAGDTISWLCGDTFLGSSEASLPVNLTTSTGFRYFNSYGSGAMPIFSLGANLQGILATNIGFSITGIKVTANTVTTYSGTFAAMLMMLCNDGATHSDGMSVTNCLLNGGQEGAVATVQTNSATVIENITMTNNTVLNCFHKSLIVDYANSGNQTSGTNLSNTSIYFSAVNLSNNLCHDITGINAVSIAPASGPVIRGANISAGPVTIENNHVYNIGESNASTFPGGPGGIYHVFCLGVVQEFNVVHDIFYGTQDTDGNGLDIDGQNGFSRYNVVWNTQGAGSENGGAQFTSGTNVIAFNLFVNVSTGSETSTGDGGLLSSAAEGGGQTTLVYNNTVICGGGNPALRVNGDTTNFKCYNNIFISLAGVPTVGILVEFGTGCAMDGNAYQSGGGNFLCQYMSTNYTSLSAWQAELTTQGVTYAESHGVGPMAGQLVAPYPIPTGMTPGNIAQSANYAPVAGTSWAKGIDITASPYSISMGSQDLIGTAISSPYTGAMGCIATPGAYVNNYQQTILGNKPLFWARLNEPASTTVAYDSAFGFGTGTMTSCTPGTTGILLGTGATCVAFNGSTSKIIWGSQSVGYTLTQAAGITLEAWVKVPTIPSGTTCIFSFYDGTNQNATILLLATGEIRVNFTDKSSTQFLTANTPSSSFPAATLVHVVVVLTGSETMAVYINKVSQSMTYTTTNAITSISFKQISIGEQNSADFWNGDICEVAVYGSAFNQAQVTADYIAGTTIPTPTPTSSATAWAPPQETWQPPQKTWAPPQSNWIGPQLSRST